MFLNRLAFMLHRITFRITKWAEWLWCKCMRYSGDANVLVGVALIQVYQCFILFFILSMFF